MVGGQGCVDGHGCGGYLTWVEGSCVVEVVETVETSNWTVGLVVVVTTSYQSCKVPTSFPTNWAVAGVVACSRSAELRRSWVHTIEERTVELELVLATRFKSIAQRHGRSGAIRLRHDNTHRWQFTLASCEKMNQVTYRKQLPTVNSCFRIQVVTCSGEETNKT